MWVRALSEIRTLSTCKPTVHDLHSKTVIHFSLIRHHLIRSSMTGMNQYLRVRA